MALKSFIMKVLEELSFNPSFAEKYLEEKLIFQLSSLSLDSEKIAKISSIKLTPLSSRYGRWA